MIRALAALVIAFALPAHAEMAFKAEALLATPATAQAGALIACATGALDPAAADKALTGAGWAKTPGEGDGTFDYALENLTVMLWDTPGFCMVDDSQTSTTDMANTFLGLSNLPPDIGTDADGCTTYILDTGVTATLNGPGNDPTCTSDTGAAMRFSLPN